MRRRLSFIFLLTILWAGSFAQVDTASISAKLTGNKSLRNNVVCLIAKDGKLIYKKESADFTAKTQQPVGLTSEWFTAALVMTYVQEGKLSLDDKVTDYIPLFAKYSKRYITIRHCLTHNTGIESEWSISKPFAKSKFNTLEEEVNAFASKREIETNPGTEFKFSNIGFALVGRVLEIISKKGFDRIMQDRLLRPCGMRGSTFTNEDYNAATNPNAGARSTANDLINFMTMLLNKGTFNNKQVLSPESVNTLLSISVNQPMKNVPPLMKGESYALGSWAIEDDNNGKARSLTSPSLTGSWPVVDFCRGYAMVILTSVLQNAPPQEYYLDIKNIVDAGLPCK